MNFIYERVGKMLDVIKSRIRLETVTLSDVRFCECGYKMENTPPSGAVWQKVGDDFSLPHGKETHGWFSAHVEIPESFRRFDVTLCNMSEENQGHNTRTPQYICYIDGKMTAAFDVYHREIPIDTEKNAFDLLLYIYVPSNARLYGFNFALCKNDADVRRLYYDLKIPYDIMTYSDKDTKSYCDKRDVLNEALNLLDLRESGDEWHASVKNALSYLEDGYKKLGGKNDIFCTCTGHTHIDVAWLWTFAQTREKVQRSFSSMINLMKRYPRFRFMSSQPQLYKFLKEEAPDVYSEVKELIKSGRWEAEGAMWVEADCNLTSGESLVRQILFGKRFFKNEFGVDSRVLWLPDVFGYSPALPQILKKCGVDYFVTSKISWNETNKMPYDTFMWRGIDGSEVLAYFLTAQHKRQGELPSRFTSYNATTDPSMIQGAWERYQQKELSNEVLVAYGYGDGGGGPTSEQIETAQRLTEGIDGCPTVRFDSVRAFLDRLSKKVSGDKRLPRWTGELYLEYHRGTYTSQARNKKLNRRSEFLYQNAETAALIGKYVFGKDYPADTLHDGWEKLLLCQFHDIIPGSSIKEVYRDSEAIYSEIIPKAESICESYKRSVIENIGTDGGYVVFNPNSFNSSSTVRTEDGLIYAENIPSKGYAVIQSKRDKSVTLNEEARTLENDFMRVTFGENMNIISLFDKETGRELAENGKELNSLIAFEDYPRAYDAWEITNYYNEKSWNIDSVDEVKPIDEGERSGFLIRRTFGMSVIEQKICLYAHEKRLDFDTEIDWSNDHILLKAAFPFDINADFATYDTQYGNIRRATHRNTSWDDAKFEVCMHKFADISESGCGISVINDCKYGCDTLGSEIRITLLKSATYPDSTADKCHHSFSYSLFPHSGDFRASGTIRRAYEFNNPMTAYAVGKQSGKLPESYSFVSIDGENAFIETVKKAEDSDFTIVRVCDEFNCHSVRKLTFGFEIKEAYLCDMLENRETALEISENSVTLPLKPFEIATIAVK